MLYAEENLVGHIKHETSTKRLAAIGNQIVLDIEVFAPRCWNCLQYFSIRQSHNVTSPIICCYSNISMLVQGFCADEEGGAARGPGTIMIRNGWNMRAWSEGSSVPAKHAQS